MSPPQSGLPLTTPHKTNLTPISVYPLYPALFFLVTAIISGHMIHLFIGWLVPASRMQVLQKLGWFVLCCLRWSQDSAWLIAGAPKDLDFLSDRASSTLDHMGRMML